jgi:membrane protease YdiL (CAAX protease family)
MNALANTVESLKQKGVTLFWPVVMLFLRTVFSFSFGLFLWLFFSLMGIQNAFQETSKWWPLQLIFTNIITFFILWVLVKKEGIRYCDLFNIDKSKIKKDLLLLLALIVPFAAISMGAVYGVSFLFYGGPPPEYIYQRLPFLAALLFLIIIPVVNVPVELAVYFGYSMQRIEAATEKTWLALLLSSFALAFHHLGHPILFDLKYTVWTFLAYFPIALLVGIIYMKMRRLTMILIGHFLMDVQLVVFLFLKAIG